MTEPKDATMTAWDWCRLIGACLAAYLVLDHLFHHDPPAPSRIIIVPIILNQGDRIVPAEPDTGLYELPSAQDCCKKA